MPKAKDRWTSFVKKMDRTFARMKRWAPVTSGCRLAHKNILKMKRCEIELLDICSKLIIIIINWYGIYRLNKMMVLDTFRGRAGYYSMF